MAIVESSRGALANAARDLVAAVEDEGDRMGWEFSPRGPAATDWAANEQPSGWGVQPLQDAYRTGALLWYVVVDHAWSVADLLDSGRTLGLLAASRSLAEAAARSELLLRTGTDPSIRIRRMINERLYALHEDWRFANDITELDSSWQLVTANRVIDVAETDLALEVGRPTEHRPGWVGKKRESTMTALGDMIRSPMLAAMFYKNTSAASHAALHGLVKRLEFHGHDADVYKARLRAVTTAEATTEITTALVALAIVARALLIQAGWETRHFDAADTSFQAIIQTLTG